MKHQNISVTGSLNLNGVGVVTSASLNAYTASSDTKIDALIGKTGSYATTGSNTFTGGQIVQGTLTAQTLVVQTVTSSVLYTTGSNIIGSSLNNVQELTGSVGITGSLSVKGDTTVVGSITAQYGGLSQAGSATAITQNARFTNTTTSTANGSGVGFDFALYDAAGSGKQTGQVASVWSDNSSNDVADLAFYTRPTGAGISEKVRITGNGNVGIGTTAPSRLLEVSTGSDTYVRVTGNRGNADGVHVGNVEFYNSFSSRLVGEVRGVTGTGGTQSNSGQLAFYTNSDGTYAERMRITSAGYVGIGTTSPGQLFEVVGGEIKAGRVDSTNEGGQVSFGRASDNNTAWYVDVYGNTSTPSLRFVDVTAGAVRMTVKSNGDLQLNTAGMFYSNNSTVSVAPGGTTIFTPPLASGMYLVTYVIGGNATNVGYAIVGNRFGSTLYILASGAGSQTSLSVSGLNLVLSQSASGANLNTSVSYIILNSGAAV